MPDHEPLEHDRVWPTAAVPEAVGELVLLGASGTRAALTPEGVEPCVTLTPLSVWTRYGVLSGPTNSTLYEPVARPSIVYSPLLLVAGAAPNGLKPAALVPSTKTPPIGLCVAESVTRPLISPPTCSVTFACLISSTLTATCVASANDGSFA